MGTTNEWKEYRKELEAILEENKSILDRHELPRFFKHLDREGTPYVESDGSVWVELWENGEPLRVGVSANNALAEGSSAPLTYKFLLARTAGILKSPKHSRETMAEFKQDWHLLERASADLSTVSAGNPSTAKSLPAAWASSGGKD